MCQFTNSNLLRRGMELMLFKYLLLSKLHEAPLCALLHSSFEVLIAEGNNDDFPTCLHLKNNKRWIFCCGMFATLTSSINYVIHACIMQMLKAGK